jgi:hypothetical protein
MEPDDAGIDWDRLRHGKQECLAPFRKEQARYADPVTSPQASKPIMDEDMSDGVRDPLADSAAVIAARSRSMSERLELALSWNSVAAELRAGLAATTRAH